MKGPRRHLWHRILRRGAREMGRAYSLVRPPEYSPGPKYVLVQLTYKCNMHCSFCPQWGSTGSFKEMTGKQLQGVLSLEHLKRFVDELPASCGDVGLWGGETLLYPDLIPLIRHIQDSGRHCEITTNGSLLEKHAAALVAAGTHSIAVSIDALEADHDKERGPGAYRRAIQGIRRINEERARVSAARPLVWVGSVLLPESVEQIPAMLREVRAAGVVRAFLGKVSYTNKAVGIAHTEAFQTLFGVEATRWKGFLRPDDPEAGARVAAVVRQLKEAPEFRGFVDWATPSWEPEHFQSYYSDPSFTYPATHGCRFPWESVCLYPNGDLSPCPDYPDFIVGNIIRDGSFRKIWNGKKFLDFRRKVSDLLHLLPVVSLF
jgi:MoaA/NifB/PqqE/SkfB family radical SAM enzyme